MSIDTLHVGGTKITELASVVDLRTLDIDESRREAIVKYDKK